MSLRDTLTKNFPTGTTEYGPDHATRSLVISEEGFKDFVKRRLASFSSKKAEPQKPESKFFKDSPAFKAMQEHMKWVEENIIKGDPSKHQFIEGSVTLGVTDAAFFYRNGRLVDDVVKSVASDIASYQSIVNRYKTQIETNIKQTDKIKKEAEAFESRDKYPEGLEEFAQLMKKWENYVSPVSPNFQEPNVDFLGYGKQPFAKNGLFLLDDDMARPVKVGELKIDALTPERAKQLTVVIRKLIALGDTVGKIIEGGVGIDASDPPFRGYYKEVGNKDKSLLMPYTMPNFEAINTALFQQISERLKRLEEAMISYIKKSIKS